MNHTLEYWLREAVRAERCAIELAECAARARRQERTAAAQEAERCRDKYRREAAFYLKTALDAEASERAAIAREENP